MPDKTPPPAPDEKDSAGIGQRLSKMILRFLHFRMYTWYISHAIYRGSLNVFAYRWCCV